MSELEAKAELLLSDPTFTTVANFIRHGNKHFEKHPTQDEHLDDSALKQFGFKRVRIDYKTGATGVGGLPIVKPKPFNALGFSDTQAENYFGEIHGLINSLGVYGPLGIGRMMASEVQSLLHSGEDLPSLFNEPWQPESEFFCNHFNVFARGSGISDIRCFNGVSDDFQDGAVSLSELYIACWWIAQEFMRFDMNRKVAVTVWSVAGNKCRITQVSMLDGREAPMRVLQSDIFPLIMGKKDIRSNPGLLMSWFKDEFRLKFELDKD